MLSKKINKKRFNNFFINYISFYLIFIIVTLISIYIFYLARVKNNECLQYFRKTPPIYYKQSIFELYRNDYVDSKGKYLYIHFVLYFIFGLLYRNKFEQILLLSIIYELIEAGLDFQMGTLQDIAINFAGYASGVYAFRVLKKVFLPKNSKKTGENS